MLAALPTNHLLSRFAERRLLAAFRRREQAAFDTLFARHGSQVLGFALHLTGCRADAEDLTQETFLAAYQAAHTFKGDARLSTWLLGITARRWQRRDAPAAPRRCRSGTSKKKARHRPLNQR